MPRYPAVARLVAGILFLLTLTGPSAAHAQQRIVAIVNDEIISAYDLEARMRLVFFSTQLSDTPAVRDRIRGQALDVLINETLQIQEARRLNIDISQDDINRAIGMMERQNNIPAGELDNLLRQSNVPKEALRAQSRANLAWYRLIDLRLRPRVVVSDEEIDEILQRIEARQGQTEYRLGEILLPVATPGREADVLQTANRLIEQMSRGARFSAIAREFSDSPTAAVGGDLGWVHESDLDPELLRALSAMRPGQLSMPLRTRTGFRITLLREQRKIAEVSPARVLLDLHQLLLPNKTGGNGTSPEAEAERIRAAATSCEAFDALAGKARSPLTPALGKMELTSLSERIRIAVAPLAEGNVSEPIRTPDGLLLLMVCSREDQAPRITLPDREAIRERLHRERLSRLAQRYLRDLRLAAVVDLRG